MRTLTVYPKAILDGSEWTLVVKVYEPATQTGHRFTHTEPGGVTASVPLVLLKLCFDLTVADTDTDQDVDDALYVDDIKPGPQTETVWGNWRDQAETIIGGLPPGYTVKDFQSGWSHQDTAKVRTDARRALITQRGWTVGFVHQHEGDGTVTEE